MKYIIAAYAGLALTGCGQVDKFYDCGNEKFFVTSEYIQTNKGVTIPKVNGKYQLTTPLGTAVYTVGDDTINTKVGAFDVTLNCKVEEAVE